MLFRSAGMETINDMKGSPVRPVGRKAARQAPVREMPVEAKQAPAQQWEPNFNYLVTNAIDQLLGQRWAEEGRERQQYWETHPFQGW